ncbi:pyridoxal phosphate-dependent aminotransferase [Streptomyces xinghaiensis]|uniref:pyridoxal phosphate-dependent aminotransferase n=1 Tax=Streptomyces xinghaiensis TaxID=1038928 RepID=UPI003990504B
MSQPLDTGVLRSTAHSPSWAMLNRLSGNDTSGGAAGAVRQAEGSGRVAAPAPPPATPLNPVAPYGNGAAPQAPGGTQQRVDFCIPCNPYFPTPHMFGRLRDSLETILKYYPSDADTVTAELCTVLGLNPQTVAMGNGSTELITWIDHLLVEESLAVPIPTFGRWTDQPLETGKRVDMFPLREEQDFALDLQEYVRFIRRRGSRVAVVCNPNNPDGGYLRRSQIVWLLDELADLDLVVIDESFIDFVDAERAPSVAEEATIRPNVVVLKSLGKNFGLHGIRFGYCVANPALAATIRNALPKWNLNAFAETVVFMLKEYGAEYQQSLSMLASDRANMAMALAALPELVVFLSQGNFLLVKLPNGVDGVALRDRLLTEHGLYVRECGNKLGSSSRFLRLVVRPYADVERLVAALRTCLYGTRPSPQQQQQQPQQPSAQQPRPAQQPPHQALAALPVGAAVS